MWTRALLKDNAKRALRGRYWRAFLVCFVLGLLGVTTSGGRVNLNNTLSFGATAGESEVWDDDEPDVWTGNDPAPAEDTLETIPAAVWGMIGSVFLSAAVIALAVSIFVSSPLQVGMHRYFMENRQSPAPFATVWTVFRTPYLNVVKVQLLTTLKILLGTILFVIPGIYWSYCYAMVPYLLAENPYMTTGRAMELSRQMMDGEKWNAFVLGLSFFGWYLLGALLMGLGGLFVNPYYQATFAELYAALRSKAFALHLTDANELGGFVRHDPNP